LHLMHVIEKVHTGPVHLVSIFSKY